jgi:hypothetical protein
MSDSYRDDAPGQFSLHRRRILIGGGVLLGSLAAGPAMADAAADAAADASTALASATEFARQFLQLSSLLIPHRLDRDVGIRLAAALRMRDAAFASHVTGLLEIATRKQATVVEEFFPDVADGPLKDAALQIISAWYLGVIVDEPQAEVFAFELALMYQPTLDVMTIPSYAISGPNGWTANAPPLSEMPKF